MVNKVKTIGYIYLIRPREFLVTDQMVFKVGMTRQQPNNNICRLNDFPKQSGLYFSICCDTSKVVECKRIIKQKFKMLFKNHIDGSEYFIGNPDVMIRIIFETVTSLSNMKDYDHDDSFKDYI